MKFDTSQGAETLGPYFVENALSKIPIFGPEKIDFDAIAEEALKTYSPDDDLLVDEAASTVPLPQSFMSAKTVAEKLQLLRAYVQDVTRSEEPESGPPSRKLSGIALNPSPSSSNRSLHEDLLRSTVEFTGFPKAAQIVLDHVMLLRAKENYLFDCQVNRAVVADDPWLKGVWGWIGGKSIWPVF
jgi:WD repeat-containing protein mio